MPRDLPPRLYHFTCKHAFQSIILDGQLVAPASLNGSLGTARMLDEGAPRWLTEVVWLTDLDQPYRELLGLTRRFNRCDRTRHRFTAEHLGELAGLQHWPTFRRTLTGDDLRFAYMLEANPSGVRPAHWWVAPGPVPIDPDSHQRLFGDPS
jgi:hypothetical protein